MEIGIQLSVKKETLDVINKKYHRNVVRCKREMFKESLKHGLTWKDLLDAFSQLHLEVVVSKIKATIEFKEDEGEEKVVPVNVSGWVWFQQCCCS